MYNWQTEKAERNRRSLRRLSRSLPAIFPQAVLARAIELPFIPPTPRLAIDSYWRAHPIRADRLARALAARSGAPTGWTWQLGSNRKSGLPNTFRTPPAPYRECAYARGAGFCCICGQPIYRFGWHVDVERRSKQKRELALRLCDRMGILECAEWRGSAPTAPPSSAMRPNGWATLEGR